MCFDRNEDVAAFGKLQQQPIAAGAKSIWFPFKERESLEWTSDNDDDEPGP